jgi:hypothetical protein
VTTRQPPSCDPNLQRAKSTRSRFDIS